nr:MAG TPA: hypothetical protein [Inoviridae sp.]
MVLRVRTLRIVLTSWLNCVAVQSMASYLT